MKEENLAKIGIAVLASIGMLFLIMGLGLLSAFPIKWCWNATMTVIFGLPPITWGKAWCLHFLACMFFKTTKTIEKK